MTTDVLPAYSYSVSKLKKKSFYYGVWKLHPSEDFIGMWFSKGGGFIKDDEKLEAFIYKIVGVNKTQIVAKEYSVNIVKRPVKLSNPWDEEGKGIGKRGKPTGRVIRSIPRAFFIPGEDRCTVGICYKNQNMWFSEEKIDEVYWMLHAQEKVPYGS